MAFPKLDIEEFVIFSWGKLSNLGQLIEVHK